VANHRRRGLSPEPSEPHGVAGAVLRDDLDPAAAHESLGHLRVKLDPAFELRAADAVSPTVRAGVDHHRCPVWIGIGRDLHRAQRLERVGPPGGDGPGAVLLGHRRDPLGHPRDRPDDPFALGGGELTFQTHPSVLVEVHHLRNLASCASRSSTMSGWASRSARRRIAPQDTRSAQRINRASFEGVANRVSSTTLSSPSSPPPNAREISGNASSACAAATQRWAFYDEIP
jgi:hypothetical protein